MSLTRKAVLYRRDVAEWKDPPGIKIRFLRFLITSMKKNNTRGNKREKLKIIIINDYGWVLAPTVNNFF